VAKKYIKIKNNKKWETGENRSAGIDNQKKDRVAVAVVVELVVDPDLIFCFNMELYFEIIKD
jgi:hypothetical protein